jgi:type VI secretion system protein
MRLLQKSRPMRRKFLLQCMAAVAAVPLAGCSTVKSVSKDVVSKALNFVGLKGTILNWSQVVIAATPGANQNSPVAVDIVLVIEETSMEKLAALSAAKWFQTRADMLRTYPGTYSYKSFEVAPGQTLRIPGAQFGSPSVVGVFVFADYLNPGEHRMRVETLQNGIIVELGVRGFSVSPFKAD